MLRALILALPLVLPVAFSGPAFSQIAELAPLSERAPAQHAMLEAVGTYDILEVMSAEGLAQGTMMEDNMFPGRGGDAWLAVVSRIHATDTMIERFEAAWPVARMSDADVAEVTAFAQSETGVRVFEGELQARRAFLDPAFEEAAGERFRRLAADNDPRIDLLTRFNTVNDLVERNVMGALNGNFAFYRGLADGGAFEVDVQEELMLAEVWGQEAEMRAELIEWLYSYQTAAYSRLSNAEIEAYVALGETDAGQALNAALFEGFNVLFDKMNYELGRAAGIFIRGEDT